MRELLRLWWPGVKLALSFAAVGALWSGLTWCYSVVAGWLPHYLFAGLGLLLAIVFFPISLAIAVAESKPRQDDRS